MKHSYLEVTFRHGRPLAAYLYLPRQPADRSYRTARVQPGLIVDFNRSGRPVGIEITASAKLSAAALNRVLRRFGLPTVTPADLEDLHDLALVAERRQEKRVPLGDVKRRLRTPKSQR